MSKYAGKLNLGALDHFVHTCIIYKMSKRRRRSEASESEADEYPAKRKKGKAEWVVPVALSRQVGRVCGAHLIE